MLSELLKVIDAYLIGKGSLKEIESYLVTHLQEILDSGDEKAIELTNHVDVDLMEFGMGTIDEKKLWDRLEIAIRIGETISFDHDYRGPQSDKQIIIRHTTSSSNTIEILKDLTPAKTLHFSHTFN